MINSQQLIKQILQYDVGLWYNHKKVFSFTERDCCFVVGIFKIWNLQSLVLKIDLLFPLLEFLAL